MTARKPRRRSVASRVNDLIGLVAPATALRREQALQKRGLVMSLGHYDGAGRGPRGKDFRVNNTDAIEASRHDRARLAWVTRDMLRNNPRAVKAEWLITGQTVGKGIVPRVKMADEERTEDKAAIERLLAAHCMSTALDADGRLTLFGLQALAMSQIVSSGETLVRRRMRRSSDGLPLPFQVQCLEGDFLDENIDGPLANGRRAVQGVEFDAIGRRIAYHLFAEHPGGRMAGITRQTRRIGAENVIHAFDQRRPGQVRGVSWFAPVITLLHEILKYQDGQVRRQEIASLFAGILKSEKDSEELAGELEELRAGALLTIGSDEEMDFTDPPTVEGYEEFMRATDRVIAGALGLTYESFSGNLSNVNFLSGKMGRLDTDPNVHRWQWRVMIDQVCMPLGNWLREAIGDVTAIDPADWQLLWTPPTRPMIDPTKEYAAHERAIRAGLKGRRAVIRETGEDPLEVEAEIVEERKWADENDLVFTSDAGAAAAAPAQDGATRKPETEEDKTDD